MRLLNLLLLLMLKGTPTVAQVLPQLYDVANVASDDALNIRIAPAANAAIIGVLAHDATAVEVVDSNPAGTWGQINHGESIGWVNLSYLAPRGVHIDNYNLPVGLSCYGTEPFWSLSNADGAMRYETPDLPARDMDVWIAQDSGIADDFRRMIKMAGIGGPAVAFLYPANCSDGMSDRAFGLAISLMTAPDAALLSGCCSLTPPAK